MAENKRNRNQQSDSLTQQNQNDRQDNQRQNSSTSEQDQNPQEGGRWSNYRTREMSDEGYSKEGLSDTSGK